MSADLHSILSTGEKVFSWSSHLQLGRTASQGMPIAYYIIDTVNNYLTQRHCLVTLPLQYFSCGPCLAVPCPFTSFFFQSINLQR